MSRTAPPLTVSEVARSFADFYRSELRGQVRRAALIVGSADHAGVIVQDAMIEVYCRWDELDSPGGYLSRSVLNGCRDACRRRSTARRLLHLAAPPPRPLDAGDPLDDVLNALVLQTKSGEQSNGDMTRQPSATGSSAG